MHLRDIGSSFCQCAQLPQRIAALDDDEMPTLTIHTTPRQPPRLNYPPDDLWRHWFILVIAHRQQRAHCLEDFYRCLLSELLRRLRLIHGSLYHHDEGFKVGAIRAGRQSNNHWYVTGFYLVAVD